MFYKYKKRGKKGQIPTELIYTIVGVVLLIILFSVGYNYSKGSFGKERDKCYDNIIKNVNYLLSEKKVFDSVQGVDCILNKNHVIIAFDSDWNNKPVSDVIKKPDQCGGRSCICLFKYKKTISSGNIEKVIKCKTYSKNIRFRSNDDGILPLTIFQKYNLPADQITRYNINPKYFGIISVGIAGSGKPERCIGANTCLCRYYIYGRENYLDVRGKFEGVAYTNTENEDICGWKSPLYIEKDYIKNSDTTYILITKQTKDMTDRYNKLLKSICYKGDSSCIGVSEGAGFDHYSCFKDENENCKRYNQCNPGDSNCACPKGDNEFEYSEFTCCNGLDGSHILSCFDYKDKGNCEKDSCNVLNKLTDPFNKYKCEWKMNIIDNRYECQQVEK